MSRLSDRVNGLLRRGPTWPLYVLGMVPAGWFLWLGLTGGLGPEPIKALEHKLGETALQLLIVVLAVTPLRRFTGISLIRFRRALGLLAFAYVALHLATWAFLDVQSWGRVWADIVKRPYITIGMAGFVLMLPLALTSNNWSIRRLRANWRKLHRLTYAIVVLGGVHYVMLVKGWQTQPLVYLAVILLLLGLRFQPARRRQPA
ncbi:protein-methionine-sulfoxide reductase heme-binding subunit MsrQ [Actibacterium sp.]|uniref:protein-methionine-sulfoxide reductase heme-binding subunit MsrQ n=1 Tax=Actibacterium sp. TaxID=1872125 RepID=UPI0035637B2F